MRWGSKGSLVLQLAGSKAGLWYDHEQRRGGDIIELTKQEQGCDFIAALRFAQQFVGGSAPRPNSIRNISTLRIVADDGADELRRIEQAMGFWCRVRPLAGRWPRNTSTLATRLCFEAFERPPCLALAVAGLAALYRTATAWFHRWTTETDVTNMRVVHKTGFSVHTT